MTNIAAILDARLGPPRAGLLRSASRAAANLGLSLHLVGGSVRDALLGQAPADLDVAYAPDASGQPRRRGGFQTRPPVAAALAQALGGQADPPTPFGTAKLRIGDVSLDLVMARRETYPSPGALPAVQPGALADDLARRDFSINAMAVSLSAGSWGRLADPFDGAGDLQRRTVRVLHPASFRDDPTRLFRAARYAGRLGFRLDPETERLARDGAACIDTVSGDRVSPRARAHLRRAPRGRHPGDSPRPRPAPRHPPRAQARPAPRRHPGPARPRHARRPVPRPLAARRRRGLPAPQLGLGVVPASSATPPPCAACSPSCAPASPPAASTASSTASTKPPYQPGRRPYPPLP